MTLKLKNIKELSRYLLNYSKRIEEALIYSMEFMVANLQNHAKASAGYQDQTSNLKSSIGGVVLKNGKPVTYKGFQNEGLADNGSKIGLEFLNSLISENNQGYVIIIVAGMNYATYVENYYGLNVLKKSELKMRREMPIMLNKLKKKMENVNN